MNRTESSLGTTAVSRIHGCRYDLAAVLAALLAVSAPGLAMARPLAQDVPGIEGLTIAPVRATPTASPTPTPAATKPPRRLLLPPDVVAEPESVPTGLGLPTGAEPRGRAVRVPTSAAVAPTPTPTPTPTQTLGPTPTPLAASPPPAERPVETPTGPLLPEATPTPAPVASTTARTTWPIVAGGALAVLLLALGGWVIAQRRRAPGRDPVERTDVEQADVERADSGRAAAAPMAKLPAAPPVAPPPQQLAEPSPLRVPAPNPSADPLPVPPPAGLQPKPAMLRPAAPEVAPALRPWLEIDFVAKRAGTNLTSATVDFELGVRNIGSVAAHDVRILVQLLTANPAQSAQLHAVFRRPVDQPIMAPFGLDPLDTARINAVGTLASDKINQIDLDGRTMFVPILAVRAVYGWAGNKGEQGTTANAYILGVDRDGQEKMEPLWLDNGPRMADRITHRLHEIGIRR